jgi:hypothetical protein
MKFLKKSPTNDLSGVAYVCQLELHGGIISKTYVFTITWCPPKYVCFLHERRVIHFCEYVQSDDKYSIFQLKLKF